jgi:hypothetical protein
MKTLNQQTATKEIQVLTTELIFDLLVNETKSTICAIEYIVDDNRSKTIQKQVSIQKHVKINNVYLNHDYTKKVQKLTNDETFEAQPLKGKERISTTILKSLSSNKLLLDGKVLAKESAKILGYFNENKAITETEALAKGLWGNSYFKVVEKQTMGRGSVSEEDDFNIINTTLDKIVYLKFKGIEYRR